MRTGVIGAFTAAFFFAIGLSGCGRIVPKKAEEFPPDAAVVHVTFEWMAFDAAARREIWLMRETAGKLAVERIDERDFKHQQAKEPGLELVARSKNFLMPVGGKGYFLKLMTEHKSGPPEMCLYALEDSFKFQKIKFQETIRFRDTGKPLRLKVCDSAATPAAGAKARLVFRSGIGTLTLWEGKANSAGEIPFYFHNWFFFKTELHNQDFEYMRRFRWEFSHPELGKLTMVLLQRPNVFSEPNPLPDFDEPYPVCYAVPFRANREAWKKVIEGRVVTMRGDQAVPVAGATVCPRMERVMKGMMAKQLYMGMAVETDREGRFAIALRAPDKLAITAPGYDEAIVDIPNPGEKVSVKLVKAGQ